jgi:hypothetical protein
MSLSAAVELYETEFLAARNLAFRSRREYLDDLKDLLVYLTSVSPVLRVFSIPGKSAGATWTATWQTWIE